MSAREKFGRIFGKFDSLAHKLSWTMGLANMLDWLTWSTNDVLGVTKTHYRNQIVKWSHEAGRNASFEATLEHVKKKIKMEMVENEGSERYSRGKHGIASPREALRRAKFFSEDYLNKEFDIFMTLASDRYLDRFYGRFTAIAGGGEWFTHGNGGLFATSTGISEMQMDNVCYNPSEKLLVANELKLGGKKNPDQILKYALMYRCLRAGGYIASNTRLLLLFIGDVKETRDWQELIQKEMRYCKKNGKSTGKECLAKEGVEVAGTAEKDSTTWREVVAFNEEFMETLDVLSQQVERKLLWGFNETLRSKWFMQPQ